MPQINPPNFSSIVLDFSDLLNILEAILKFRKTHIQEDKTYQYNHDYLNPLAITNVEEIKIPLIPFAIPILSKNERPNLRWIALVISSIVTIRLNSSAVNQKVDTLQEISHELEHEKSPEHLNHVVSKLELTLKEIIDDIEKSKIQTSSQSTRFHQIKSSFKERFETIANHLEELFENFTDDFPDTEEAIIDNLEEIIKSTAKLIELTDNQTSNLESFSKSSDLAAYDNQFQVIPKPTIANTFQQDQIFAYLQVAGINPVVIQQYQGNDSRLPITELQYSLIAQKFGISDSLNAALADGRLYISDYTLLDGLVNGNFINANLEKQKYISAPVALFAVPPVNHPSRSLFPVAISYQKTTVSYQWIVFTPLDADSAGEPWMTAKSIVETANCSHHEIISHLGRTHLVVEPFIVPTYNLPNQHPLKNLLIPHLEGTVLINYGAHAFLVAPGGSVDSLLASSITADQALATTATQSYLFNFNEISFPQTLVSRNVNDSSKLPTYPYRDDGLLIWNALENWVSDYLRIYYSTDTSVAEDKDLQTWASTLVSLQGGRLQNFGDHGQGKIQTVDYLIKAVSTLIFIASAQHAAVNFPQKELMMYTPAFPMAYFLPNPTNTQDSQNFIQGLPSLEQAQNQINVLYLLGSIYYTKLGQYSASAFPENRNLQVALNKFQTKLKEAEITIQERNQSTERLIPYEFLLPTKIPQSINI